MNGTFAAERAAATPQPEGQPGDGGGLRYNAGKPRYDLIPPEMLDALATYYGQGGGPPEGPPKYTTRNWERGMSWTVCFAALMRHGWKWMRGQDTDPETGVHHMIAVVWNATAIYTYAVRGIGEDDRPATGRAALTPTPVAAPMQQAEHAIDKLLPRSSESYPAFMTRVRAIYQAHGDPGDRRPWPEVKAVANHHWEVFQNVD